MGCERWSGELKAHFQKEYQMNRLVLINCYAPHMGITAKIPEETEQIYRGLDELLKLLKGKDNIILGDFSTKLGL